MGETAMAKVFQSSEGTKAGKCKDKVHARLASRIADLKKLWAAIHSEFEDVPDLGNLFEYGLSFDYVAPDTFEGQPQGYFRYQLSWGGPSDEFRFYCAEGFKPVQIEYWYMDWFDGAHIVLTGNNETLLCELFDWFEQAGSVENEYKKAVEA